MVKRLLCVSILIALAVSGAAAQDFSAGVAALNRGDYLAAIAVFRPLAEKGDVEAQKYLGNIYKKGEGVPRDLALAVKWFEKAAGHGDKKSQYYVAVAYHRGRDVPRDYVKAVYWAKKAAAQGHSRAQYYVAMSYRLGRGAPQDHTEAAKWFRKSAEAGYGRAIGLLGYSYMGGEGVPRDLVEAYKWLGILYIFTKDKSALKVMTLLANQLSPDDRKKGEWLAKQWAKAFVANLTKENEKKEIQSQP